MTQQLFPFLIFIQDTSDARYALITFSSVAHLEKSFTTNRSQISEALEKRSTLMGRKSGCLRVSHAVAISVFCTINRL